jgi:3-keto-disaccharide hydrolase
MSHITNRLAASTALIAIGVTMGATMSARADEWKPLFNGRDLSGWNHVGPGRFVVENGQLRTEGGMGLLWYAGGKLENVVLRVVYRTPDAQKGGNSGVFIRIPTEPTEPWMPVNRGYEVQIDASGDDFHRTGVLYSLTKALGTPPVQEWNTMEITLDGDRTAVTVNGVKITDYREGDPVPEKKNTYEPDRGRRPTSGYIGLQNHNDKDVVYFREISVRKLGGDKAQ